MSWCPKCNVEYRPGFSQCADCRSPLTDNPPFAEPNPSDDAAVFLAGFEDSFFAEQAVALLEDQGIPVIKKSPGSGDFMEVYMGRSLYGADLYVGPDKLQQAKEVLMDFSAAELPPEVWDVAVPEESPELPVVSREKLSQALAWLLLLAFLPGAIAALIHLKQLSGLLFPH